MNSLFNAALKQSSLLRTDLDAFASSPESSPAALQGQISATIASFSRTIDDYSETSKRELNAAKQEKAKDRIKAFRSELQDYRSRFDSLKQAREETQTAHNRAELFGRRSFQTQTPENPYAQSSLPTQSAFAPSSYNRSALGASPYEAKRESHALREQSFFQQGNAQLDEYLERGRAVLSDLGSQREILKGTQKRLYDVGSTLGISGDTIRMVERRARQDKWIFWGGVVTFFLFCWLVLHFLRG